jgi:hypothetical protein
MNLLAIYLLWIDCIYVELMVNIYVRVRVANRFVSTRDDQRDLKRQAYPQPQHIRYAIKRTAVQLRLPLEEVDKLGSRLSIHTDLAINETRKGPNRDLFVTVS